MKIVQKIIISLCLIATSTTLAMKCNSWDEPDLSKPILDPLTAQYAQTFEQSGLYDPKTQTIKVNKENLSVSLSDKFTNFRFISNYRTNGAYMNKLHTLPSHIVTVTTTDTKEEKRYNYTSLIDAEQELCKHIRENYNTQTELINTQLNERLDQANKKIKELQEASAIARTVRSSNQNSSFWQKNRGFFLGGVAGFAFAGVLLGLHAYYNPAAYPLLK